MTSEIIYKGNLRCEATHLQSGTSIETDAPVDNQGKGERFSPTDLVATALGNCMMTIMGIKARDMNLNLEGTKIGITKIMASEPRRISEIKATISFPAELITDQKQRVILEKSAMTCPVFQSLNPNITQDIRFVWSDGDTTIESYYDVVSEEGDDEDSPEFLPPPSR
ncbi:MAG TPA: OsmC family protein [Segetibacter sp.]|jgi:uncharacterized OsmC-like protein